MTHINSNTGLTAAFVILCMCTAIKAHILKRSTESNGLIVPANDNLQFNNAEEVTNNATRVNRDETKLFIPVWIFPVKTLIDYVTSDDRFKSIVEAGELDLFKEGSRQAPSDDKNTEISGTSSGRNINEFISNDKVLDDSDHAVGALEGQGENSVEAPNSDFGDVIKIFHNEPEGNLEGTNMFDEMLTETTESETDIGMKNVLEGPGEISEAESANDLAVDGVREYIDVNLNNELSDTNTLADGLDRFIDELESELGTSDIDTNAQTTVTNTDNSELPNFRNSVLGTERDFLSESNELDNREETTETEQTDFPNIEVDQEGMTKPFEIDIGVDILENLGDNFNSESEYIDKSDDNWSTVKEKICNQDFSPSTSFIPSFSIGPIRTAFLLSIQTISLFEKLRRELCFEKDNDNKIEISANRNTEEIDTPVPFTENTNVGLDIFEGPNDKPDISDANANDNQSITEEFGDVTEKGFNSIAVEEDVSGQETNVREVFVDDANPELNGETDSIEDV